MERTHRVALIPGASRPVGRAIARKFAENGVSLVLPYYSDWPDSTREMIDEFDAGSVPFLSIPGDLTQSREAAAVVAAAGARFGGLHYLINNIERGGMPIVHGSYEQAVNSDQWLLEQQTTLKAKWNLFHHALPLLRKSGGGAVTNITSIAAVTGRSGPVSPLFNDGFAAANRAVSLLTETWAREAAPEVRVNEVMLGLIQGRHAEQTRGWSLLSRAEQQAILDHTLLQRTGTPGETADIVYFLTVSAAYVTGSSIRVDGGYCLGGEPTLPMPPGVL